jgi:hypothetical protein
LGKPVFFPAVLIFLVWSAGAVSSQETTEPTPTPPGQSENPLRLKVYSGLPLEKVLESAQFAILELESLGKGLPDSADYSWTSEIMYASKDDGKVIGKLTQKHLATNRIAIVVFNAIIKSTNEGTAVELWVSLGSSPYVAMATNDPTFYEVFWVLLERTLRK